MSRKKEAPKIALAMICKPTDDEAELLGRCLKYIAPHVDGIFVTVTGKNKKCEDTIKLFGGVVSHFEWVYDFAAARNHSFAQVPKDYTHILWLDADDALRGGEKLRATIAAHPKVDCFSFNYLYAFDEWNNATVVHLKTRVLKNDGSVEWAGALHEDFKENREVTRFFVKGIEVLHLSTPERFEMAKERNVEVAYRDKEKHPDDPRSWWNLGNAYFAAGKLDEADGCFGRFMDLSRSDEEKYIIRLRLAELELARGNKEKALQEAQLAIGLRPLYPDGYHLAGHIYFEMKRWSEARDSYLIGLTKKPPYYQIVVYNPRSYDLVPLMALAKCYFHLSQPILALEALKACQKIVPKDKGVKDTVRLMEKEAAEQEIVLKQITRLRKMKDKTKLAAALDRIPEKYKSHPGICMVRNTHFVKSESKGNELSIFCGHTAEAWTPETAKTKGIGGSEEAVIHLSRELTKLGWDVTVYNNCGHKELVFDGVKYRPFWAWNPKDVVDVLVVWRIPKWAEYELGAKKVVMDMHDVIQDGEFTPKRVARIDKVFVKSKAHAKCFPSVPKEKFAVIPNGIVWQQFQDQSVKRDTKLVINTSSPDRALPAFVDVAEMVKKEVPDAKFKWAYGFKNFDLIHNDPQKTKWREDVVEKMKKVGVEDLGRVGHDEIAKLYQQAGVFLYPTGFFEIFCISAVKAEAAGAIPVVTNFAALDEMVQFGHKQKLDMEKENWGKPFMFDFSVVDPEAKKAMAEEVIRLLKNPPSEEARKEMRVWAEQFSWEMVAKTWDGELRKL